MKAPPRGASLFKACLALRGLGRTFLFWIALFRTFCFSALVAFTGFFTLVIALCATFLITIFIVLNAGGIYTGRS
jgi:hypothetical protein